jgi:membrane-associated phospholipid phosphatase
MSILGTFLYRLGRFGPFITFILTLFILNHKSITIYTYLAGIIFDTFINPLIKLIIRQRRPDKTKSTSYVSASLDTSKNPNHTIYPDSFIEKTTDAHRYGMPSGHAQTSAFNTMFIWLTTKSIHVTLFYIVLTFITCAQRVIARRHYIDQVIAGLVIGTVIAYFSFTILSSILKTI